jgi:hypothetical protein
LDQWSATGQVRPHLAGPTAPARPTTPVGSAVPGSAAVPSSCGMLVKFCPKCVPAHKNHNTTRGTLLVSKMCMKLVVYASRTRGFDSRIFVVRTVNKLPQAKCLPVLEQSHLASMDQGLHGVITRQVPMHKLHALLTNLKRLVRKKRTLLYLWGF